MGLSLGEAQVLSLFLTSIFLGIHLVTFALVLWTQFVRYPSRGRNINWLLVAVSVVLGTVGILDGSLGAVTNAQVWTSGNQSLFTKDTWPNGVRIVDQVIPPIVGDAMLTYRCWMVYERSWKVVVAPACIWIAGVSISVFIVAKSIAIKSASGVNDPSLTVYYGVALTLTVVLNFIATSSIVLRIWRMNKNIRQYVGRHDKLIYIIRIVIESGLLYTTAALITLLTAVTNNNADYIVGDCLVQITGIAFNLMIVRFDQNLASRSVIESHHLSWHVAEHVSDPSSGRTVRQQVETAQDIPILDLQRSPAEGASTATLMISKKPPSLNVANV
ncbi:hypothetical protein CERSUDRAFT_118836 [Gelatoporia subvermispora B]|uniref:Uncharacterized protein n=1 Tax=Ceriporiopsis subvermispora (strain B) TaxID=914234 RepID=M2QJA6_CERS8|nr:hypothetical protein CERSUDRAFT_118836 [Gelatoporia subvermispora B]